MELLRVYLVEDSPIVRQNLIETLEENAPVRVVGVAEDEASAVAFLSSDPPCDLALIDVFLKTGNGVGVLRALSGIAPGPRRAVFSNHATPALRQACEQLGAEQVFDKSNEIDELLRWVNRLARSDRSMTASTT